MRNKNYKSNVLNEEDYEQDSIDEKINELFKEFDSRIEVNNQEKNTINSNKL